MVLPNTTGPGPAVGAAGRIGMQFNHYIGLVYQNSPIVTFTAQKQISGLSSSAGFKAGFADYNTVLLMLTLFHHLDIGAGPSLDFLEVASGNVSISGATSGSSSGVSPGAHGRVALHIGGLNGNGPSRSAFTIGVDAHPLFTGAGQGLSLTGGLGAEWY
jgi:hypothetical protein